MEDQIINYINENICAVGTKQEAEIKQLIQKLLKEYNPSLTNQ